MSPFCYQVLHIRLGLAIRLLISIMMNYLKLIAIFTFPLSAWAQNLSCDLSQGEDFPKPIFVEEYHDQEKCIEMRDRLFSLASTGEIAIGSETSSTNNLGVLFDRHVEGAIEYFHGNPRMAAIHSIESELHYLVAMNYEFQILKANKINPPSQLVLSLTKYIHDFSLLKSAWDLYVSSQSKNETVVRLNNLLNSAEFISGDSKARALMMFKTFGTSVEENIFAEIQDGFHRTFVSLVNKSYSNEFDSQTLPAVVTKEDLTRLGCIGYPCQREGLYRKITLDFRDFKMAEKIGNLLCQYRGAYKNMFFIMGTSHSEGVWNLLKAWSNANYYVIPHQYSSYQPIGRSSIEAKIKEGRIKDSKP